MANNCKQCFNTHLYQPHCHPTTKSLWLCSSVYCGPPHPSRQKIWERTTCSCWNHIRGSPLIHRDGGRAGEVRRCAARKDSTRGAQFIHHICAQTQYKVPKIAALVYGVAVPTITLLEYDFHRPPLLILTYKIFSFWTWVKQYGRRKLTHGRLPAQAPAACKQLCRDTSVDYLLLSLLTNCKYCARLCFILLLLNCTMME